MRVPGPWILTLLASALALGAFPTDVSAQERWILRGNGALTLPVSSPQTELFGVGGALGAEISRSLLPYLAVGARLRLGFLSDAGGPLAPELADPGAAGLLDFGVVVRGRLPFGGTDDQRTPGPWIELSGDLVVTGANARGGMGAGLGWSFPLGDIGIGPGLWWLHTFQPGAQLETSDADVLFFGVDVVLLDATVVVQEEPPPPPPDRDGDGIPDPDDSCPDEPEDMDGFEDEDGCPDTDNDGDGILDVDDQCPMEPEDVDEFRDQDGCPDVDNDGDMILDVDDECPNYPEIVNGVDDEDGCPDEGLIQMVNDRIVLEDEVFFTFDRAFIRRRAFRHLEAIIALWRLHPEWERVRIEGHTDSSGDDEYNLRLSQRRAENVREALVERGMPEAMLEARGFGDARLLTRGDSQDSMQRNRRVEFVILSRRQVRPGEAPPAAEEPAETETESDETPTEVAP
jgi:outer membrane protein OmpA-like peptidoglycan-associated protein